eukprot:scaffold602_cov23-Cyclotella_meneghiniana.AAC.2
MFGARSHQPSQLAKRDYSDRRRKLVNYFFSMIRIRDPASLVHWAMVGTLAMLSNGGKIQHFRNPLISAFSAGSQATLKYVNQLYEATREARLKLLRMQAYGGTSYDNYNAHHSVTNHDGHGHIEHTGIIFNWVRQRAFPIPRGTVVINNNNNISWVVISSTMIDYWTCQVHIKSANEEEIETEKLIMLPSVHWRFGAVPEDPMNVEITYTDQLVPRSVRQKVPRNASHRDLLFGNRAWMQDDESDESTLRALDPREHVEIVRAARRVNELVMFRKWCAGEEVGTSDKHPNVLAACLAIDSFLDQIPKLVDRVRSYQRDSARYWNVSYDAVDQCMVFEICPRNELKNDKATLAMTHMMEEFAMLYKTKNGNLRLSKLAPYRMIFQYGDVLSIKKWYTLEFYVLRKMTHIGREDYVTMIMTVYKRFIKIHDYLHENIHRVQAIYKLFYGGFIQAVQALLGSKRVKMDPTKGSWKEHKLILRKMTYALEKLRIETFLAQGYDDECDGDLYVMQEKYKDFCLSMEKASGSKTRMCAIFMKVLEHWLICEDAIGIGDWAVLEVLGCDWIEFWAASGKHQYLLETKRRIEALYRLGWLDLEFHRMGRGVRMSEGRKFITYDHLCENTVHFEKMMAKNPNFETVCKRSRHLHAGQKAKCEVFGGVYRTKKEPSMTEDINKVYKIFKRAGVFATPDKKSEVNDNTFWKLVLEENAVPTPIPKWKSDRQHISVSPSESKTLEILWDKNDLKQGANVNVDSENVDYHSNASSDDDDNESVMAGASVTSNKSVCTVDDLVEEQVMEMSDMMGLLNATDANLESAANNLSNKCIYKYSKAIANDEGEPSGDEETKKD